MENPNARLNETVTVFLNDLNHPLRNVIEVLRQHVLSASQLLSENVKWNGPNYVANGEDRITMKINPPKNLQLIFHRGAKVQEQPPQKLIPDETGLLAWKTNDRAVATFRNLAEIEVHKTALANLINAWLAATASPQKV